MPTTRVNVPIQVTIQLDNAIQPPQPGVLAVLQVATVVVDGNGQTIGQADYNQHRLHPADLSDELIAAMDARVAGLGLTIARRPVNQAE